MPIGAPLADFRLLFGSARTMKTGDVFLLLGFRLHFLFLRLAKLRPFEGDAGHHCGGDFFVTDVSLHRDRFWMIFSDGRGELP